MEEEGKEAVKEGRKRRMRKSLYFKNHIS